MADTDPRMPFFLPPLPSDRPSPCLVPSPLLLLAPSLHLPPPPRPGLRPRLPLQGGITHVEFAILVSDSHQVSQPAMCIYAPSPITPFVWNLCSVSYRLLRTVSVLRPVTLFAQYLACHPFRTVFVFSRRSSSSYCRVRLQSKATLCSPLKMQPASAVFAHPHADRSRTATCINPKSLSHKYLTDQTAFGVFPACRSSR